MSQILNFFEKKMLNAVKISFPDLDWIEDFVSVVDDEDDFCLDVDSLYEEEEDCKKNGGDNIIIYDLDVRPEVEYSFQCEQEDMCQVYADKRGNIRTLLLDID